MLRPNRGFISEGRFMKRVLFDRPRPVLLLVAAAVLAAITVLIVLLAGRGGMSQGEALARYGYQARQKHTIPADESGSRHGGESQSGEKDAGEEADNGAGEADQG